MALNGTGTHEVVVSDRGQSQFVCCVCMNMIEGLGVDVGLVDDLCMVCGRAVQSALNALDGGVIPTVEGFGLVSPDAGIDTEDINPTEQKTEEPTAENEQEADTSDEEEPEATPEVTTRSKRSRGR